MNPTTKPAETLEESPALPQQFLSLSYITPLRNWCQLVVEVKRQFPNTSSRLISLSCERHIFCSLNHSNDNNNNNEDPTRPQLHFQSARQIVSQTGRPTDKWGRKMKAGFIVVCEMCFRKSG